MLRSKTLAIGLLLATAGPAAAQVSVYTQDGFGVQMTARIEPGSVVVPGGVRAQTRGLAHRFVLDRAQRRYFAYDLLIEPKEGSASMQVRIEPFSLTATQLAEMQVDPSWTFIPLLKFPVIPDVRAGDTVAIDLLENPATGHKVVDYLVFKHSGATPVGELPAPRDFTVADVALKLHDIRISLNGAVVDASTRFGGGITGSAVWFYLPDRGRFVMSLLPNPKLAFRRAGEVSGRTVAFTEGRDRFEIQTSSPIVPASGRFNLYVLHDPKWRPKQEAPLLVGAADRAEWLAPK